MARFWSRIRPLACVVTVTVLAVIASEGAEASSRGVASHSGKRSGVTDSAGWITAEAGRLSGRTITVVCAATGSEWAAALGTAGFPVADSDVYYGFSLIAAGEMHLSPYVCDGLRLGISAATRRSNDLQVAWAVDVLLHESVHMRRHTYDEALTEACARDGLPGELRRLYGVSSPELASLGEAASWFRRTQGAAYLGGTCTVATQR